MAFPKWFNEVEYLEAKLIQLNAAVPAGGQRYTSILQVSDAIDAIGLNAYQHYNMFGSKEGLAPSKIFNVMEYCSFKLKALQADAATKGEWAGKAWQDVQLAIHNSGMSLGDHYAQFGSVEGVSMSNAFDTTAYLTAKLAKLQAAEATKTEWATKTVTDVANAIKGAGMDAYTHYMTVKGGADEVGAAEAFPSKDPIGGGGSNTFFMFKDSVITGTAGDDIIIGADSGTLGATNIIDGGAGKDEMRLFNAAASDLANLNIASIKNVEIIKAIGANLAPAAIDVSGLKDVQEVWNVKSKNINGFTVAEGQAVGLEGLQADATTIDVKGTDGGANAQKLLLKDASVKTGVTVDSTATGGLVKVETLTIDAAGSNSIGTLTATGLQTLNITGEGGLKAVIAATGPTLKEINASAAKGDLKLDVSTDDAITATAKITLGEGNDRLQIKSGATYKLDGGAGDKDVLAVTGGNAAVNSTNYGYVNTGAKNFEVLEVVNGTAAQQSQLVASDFTHINSFLWTGTGITGTATSSTPAIAITKAETGDVFSIGMDVVHSVAAANTNGGAAVSIIGAGSLASVTLELTEEFNLTGGNGSGAISDVGTDGGAGVVLGTLSSLLIKSEGTAHTIKGGDATGGASNGNGGNSYGISNSGVKNVTVEGGADLTIAGGAAGAKAGSGVAGVSASFSNSVILNASNFTGKLTAGGSAEQDEIFVGAGGSVITGTKANDAVTFGAGVDTFKVIDAANVAGSTTDNMTAIKGVAAGDKLDFGVDNTATWTASTAKIDTVTDDDALAVAVGKADNTAHDIKWFAWKGDTYVVLADGDTDATVEDYVVKLAGVLDLSGATFDVATDTLTFV